MSNGTRDTPDAATLPAAAEAVLTFLESVGRRSEAELYLRVFRKLPRRSFAIIAPGAPVIRQGAGSFTEQVRFLSDMGLAAPIVLGLLDLPQARSARERLQKRLESAALAHRVHSADEPVLSSVLADELERGVWPVVELTEAAGTSTRERLAWLARLAADLDTRKLVLLRRRGPLHLQSERSLSLAEKHVLAVESGWLSLVNLQTDAELVVGHRLLRRDDAGLFDVARELLELSSARQLLVSITSPLDLLRELFTVKGAGTLVKRGSPILRKTSYAEVDLPRAASLLEASFGRPIRPEFFTQQPLAVYVEHDYRALAVVVDTEDAPYLAKFAVDPVAQGEGLGRDLWQVLERDFPRMFWRTRAENPISTWYAGICDGLVRQSRWHVFWRGIEPTMLPRIVEHAVAVEDDFVR